MLEGSAPRRFVLASSSPRRREIINALDLDVELASPDDQEGPRRDGETAREMVLRLSLDKAQQVARPGGSAVVLAADTAVVHDGAVLGKPADAAEAARMLRALRGRPHTVITGVTALDSRSGRRDSAVSSTEVTMRPYSDAEISAYVATGEPMDKAGAYGVQDQRFRPAEEVRGCYLNVVGLPLCDVVDLLVRLDMRAPLRHGWRPPSRCRSCPLGGMAEGP